MDRKVILILIAVVAVLLITVFLIDSKVLQIGDGREDSAVIAQQDIAITQAAPFDNVDFPTSAIPYPSNWPFDLIYPPEFILVETTSGNPPESSSMVWAVKLRYLGSVAEAVGRLESYFDQKQWNFESSDLGSNGYVVTVDDGFSFEGIFVLDLDSKDSAYTDVIGTAFQK